MSKNIGHSEGCKSPKCRGNCEDQRPVDCVVMCDAMIRGTSPYSFRSGEWAHIVGVKMSTPHGLATRAVYQCLYYDGVTDYIPVSDTVNYEIGT